MDPNYTTPHLNLRGGALADAYGYQPNFTLNDTIPRTTTTTTTTNNFARHRRAYNRSQTRSQPQSQTQTQTQTQQTYPTTQKKYPDPGPDYEPVPQSPGYERHARTLGITESLLRPALSSSSAETTPAGRWSQWLGIRRRHQRGLHELTAGGWRPTRVRFAVRWPRGGGDGEGVGGDDELVSEWVEGVYAHLFGRVRSVARGYFGFGDLPVAALRDNGGSVWLGAGFSKEFMWFAERVAMQDNSRPGGWDELLVRQSLRECLVTGVVGKVLETCVFDELLFGAEKVQREMLEAQDKCTLELDGYERTLLRSHSVQTMLGDDTLTPDFWPCVDELTLQLTTLLLPLTRLLDEHFPASQTISLRNLYQDLHTVVTEAAFLSIGIRWSRNIFRFSSPHPGDPWDRDQQQVDDTVYEASVQGRDAVDEVARAKWRTELERKQQREQDGRPTIRARVESVAVSARNGLAALRSRVTGSSSYPSASERRDVPDVWYPPTRLTKVQIVLWPMLERFATVGKTNPETGIADGENVTTIFKSQAVYYCGLTEEPADGPGEHYPTLGDWMDESKRKRLWNYLLMLRWVAYPVGIWLLLAFLARYSSIADDILQTVRHGLLTVVEHVAREVVVFGMELLITVIAIGIGIARVASFFALAVRGALGNLFGLGAQLLWYASGGIIGAGAGTIDRVGGVHGSGGVYPELSWQAMRDTARSFAGDVVWKTVTVNLQIPAGYTRTYGPEMPLPTR